MANVFYDKNQGLIYDLCVSLVSPLNTCKQVLDTFLQLYLDF